MTEVPTPKPPPHLLAEFIQSAEQVNATFRDKRPRVPREPKAQPEPSFCLPGANCSR